MAAAPAASADDPYLWLEEIEGPKALAQVKEWNGQTEAVLTAMPGYEQYRARALAILDDEQQIALPEDVQGDQVTNLWRDAKNPRGLWRVSPLAAYRAGKPEWRTLIDVDALGRQEGKSWVWHGADCRAPDYRRCLVSLSPGGTDADVVREFDPVTARFIDSGFTLPQAKSNVAWADADTLLVATDYGPDSLTTSGYPRVVKLWKRGTPLADAVTLMTGEKADVSVSPFSVMDGDTRWSFVVRGKSFWTRDMYLLAAGRLVKLPVPDDADYQGVIGGRMVALLNSPLAAAGRTFPAGALVAWPLADMAAGKAPAPELVMAPTERQAIEEVAASDNVLWVKALDDVSGQLFALRRGAGGGWTSARIPLARNNSVHLVETSGKSDLAFVTVEGMLTPPSLYAVTPSSPPELVQSLPARFDASKFSVEQRFATSADGTRIPYFLVRKKGVTGPVPALIHSYGGFKAAQTPTYLTGQPYRAGPLALFWVEEGNAYVLANLRGGGEYGPRWHEAAVKEHHQRVFDDLQAVAEDLVRTGVSAKGKIAISGRSNGGVTVGAAVNQRPDLYGAVISGSPLGDMKRYSHLLAGASWIDEYGDPDKPDEWAYLSKYSPYQNIRPGVKYPPVFFYNSTKDDRVHPGHARKMAARLKEYGNPVYYHEYMEGGHSVGADHAEDAKRAALLIEFLNRVLPGR
ncbi:MULTISPECIES: prolyl oligopeptidase family protein [Sphingomonas]|uniref:prolyl oligopeptidase family serine peptidase n=1 Tax=Sphingomonas TaxID=13687 RepID=UPI001E52D409|nr:MULTISPECIES: prolyl oligopeptidase family serine peptidase [Sphingomonas]